MNKSFKIILGGGEIADELRKEIQCLRHRVEQLETELEAKNKEIQQLSASHKMSDVAQVILIIFVLL